MKTLLSVCCFLTATISNAQLAELVWAKQIGGTLQDFGTAITTDAGGNVYTTGVFYGTADFDPGPGVVNLTAVNNDAFITKFDASGNLVWAKTFGGYLFDARAITVDASGDIYSVGSFQGTADFDPGPNTFNLVSNAGWDAYILKLNSAGDFVWAKSIGGNQTDACSSIVLDASGNIITSGWFNQTVDFDPGPGTGNLVAANNGQDCFILKLDASGNYVWAKGMGGNSSEKIIAVQIDGAGNVYSVGGFFNTGDFDPGAGTFSLTSQGGEDIFLSKLDASGNFVWAKSIGGTSDQVGNHMVLDASANILVTGYFDGTTDFDPGTGVHNLNGDYDVFTVKLDDDGNFLWAKPFGSGSSDYGRRIATDPAGDIYTAGFFQETVDFNSDPDSSEVHLMTSNGEGDVFISKLDASGNFIWAVSFGGSMDDYVVGLTVDATYNVYSTGNFQQTVDFDPDTSSSFELTSTGMEEMFVHRMTQGLSDVENVEEVKTFSVYPNPADQFSIFSWQFQNKEAAEVRVFDLVGREIYSAAVIANCKLPTAEWRSGVYFVRVNSKNKAETQKLMVRH